LVVVALFKGLNGQCLVGVSFGQGDGPRARMAHASAVVGDKVYIFGGVTAEKQLLNDIHILDVGTRLA